MNQDEKEDRQHFEEDDRTEEEQLEIIRTFFQRCMPKEKILFLHPRRFKQMIVAVKQIATLTDAYLKQYETKAEYNLRFDPLLGEDVLFSVILPDMGIFLRNEELRRILRVLPNTAELSITPLLHERASVCITFKAVRLLISLDLKP